MRQIRARSFAQRGELGGWRSRTTFVLALASAAVALGNLWRFAYLLVGWRLRPELLRQALSRESAPFFSLWWFSVRYITPLAVLVLLFAALAEPGGR